ncbi:ATP-binding protein [Paraclostridium sordellii]|uniref:ATP-binding protein n=1 Tax=Paraclostridium sordellii TaxID=1505 RepID=UPI0005DC0EAA|nr:ATP-binding protein [Paeniclostridium sordellii]CEN87078.1 sensory transduction histidine kinase [[Clostridium] sordellii] [Paeniclostridium sordellii]
MVSIYNKVSDYIIVLNFMGEIIFCNESFLKRLNYNHEEILNLNIGKIINENNNINNELKKSVEINKTLEFYSKSNELVKVNSNISIEKFNNDKSIFIIGKEVKSKQYTMEMLEDVLDNINIWAFVVDTDGKYLYVNKPFSDVLDKKREDIIGSYNSDNWYYHIYTEFEKNNREVFENKSPKIFNEKLIYGDSIHWYESYKAPIFDENKKTKYIVGKSKNIDLSKLISEELYKNYNRVTIENDFSGSNNKSVDLNKILKSIGEHILDYTKADGVSILLYDSDKEGLIPYIKLKNANKYLGNIEFIPLKKFDVYSDKHRKYLNCVFKKDKIPNLSSVDYKCVDEVCYSGNYVIELNNEFIGMITLSYKNGNAPKFNSDEYMKYICNKIAMIIKNIRLSNEVSIENKKRKYTEKELQRYLNISVDLVAVVGKDGYFKKLSPNWYDVSGWTEGELLSMPIVDIVHPKDLENFRKKNKLEPKEGEITRTIIRYRHKNGKYIYLEWSSEYVFDEEVYVTTARDITRNLEVEKEKRTLEEAVKIELVKNEFFSNISHEFRTPINIILGTMQVINKNIENNNMQINNLKKHTNYIKQNSYRLLRLVNNLIDISKMDIGMYELRCSNQNIINIIEDITLSVADYTKNNKINLIFDTSNEEVITYCDPDKIERIMLNLLSNAIKYTPENGFIKVKINSTQEEIIVSVKDSGVGIPKDKLDVIFDRFGQVDGSFNRKCEGSGIGLSLVKNLVELHGGEIHVNSEVNKGSEFVFSIPIKLKEESHDNKYDVDRKCKHVERCDIEFSDIYSI